MGVWNPKANALFLQAIELPAPERRSAFSTKPVPAIPP